MLSLSNNNQADVIEAFNSTSRYLGIYLNIEYHYLETNDKSNISHRTSVK